jgi:hypothetical protein
LSNVSETLAVSIFKNNPVVDLASSYGYVELPKKLEDFHGPKDADKLLLMILATADISETSVYQPTRIRYHHSTKKSHRYYFYY